MKKFIFIVVVILVLCAALFPMAEGYLLKRQLLAYVDLINNAARNSFTIKVNQYDVNWRRSNFNFTIVSHVPLFEALDGIQVKNTITHGPILQDSGFQFAHALLETTVFPSAKLAQSLKMQANQPIITSRAVYQFNQHLAQTFQVGAMISQQSDGRYTLTNAVGNMEVSNEMVLDATSVALKGLGLVHGSKTSVFDQQVELSQIEASPYSFTYDCELSQTNLSKCLVDFDIPTIIEKSNNQERFKLLLSKSSWVIRLDPDKKLYYDFGYLANSVSYQQQPIINHFQFQTSIGKISFDVLLYLFSLNDNAVSNVMTNEDRTKIESLIGTLINQGSYFNVSLQLDSAKGRFSFDNRLKLTGKVSTNSLESLPLLIDDSMKVSVSGALLDYLVKSGLTINQISLPSLSNESVQDNEYASHLLNHMLHDINVYTQVTPLTVSNAQSNDEAAQYQTIEAQRQYIARQSALMISDWMKDGYLLQQGNNYVMDFAMANGSMYFNGKEKSIDGLLKPPSLDANPSATPPVASVPITGDLPQPGANVGG